jgi:hypothetical protein
MYKEMKNKVVTVLTPLGEMIGRLESVDTTSVTLKDPRLFISQDGGGGFAPGISMTGEMNPKEVTYQLNNVIAILKSHDDIEKGWQQATSGIVLQ